MSSSFLFSPLLCTSVVSSRAILEGFDDSSSPSRFLFNPGFMAFSSCWATSFSCVPEPPKLPPALTLSMVDSLDFSTDSVPTSTASESLHDFKQDSLTESTCSLLLLWSEELPVMLAAALFVLWSVLRELLGVSVGVLCVVWLLVLSGVLVVVALGLNLRALGLLNFLNRSLYLSPSLK